MANAVVDIDSSYAPLRLFEAVPAHLIKLLT